MKKMPKDKLPSLEDMIEKYHALGKLTGIFEDKPNEVSNAHRHEGVILFTLAGAAKLQLDEGPWQELLPGKEVTIGDDQLHKVIAGPDGWKYLFACSEAEAEHQGILDRVS